MAYRLLADVLVAFHALFVLFVVAGGLWALRWPKAAWGHVPAALWGVAIEYGGWVCPLTPLENALRAGAGQAGYAGGFVEHYVLPVLYPAGLTRPRQVVLGSAAFCVNALVYSIVLRRARRRSGANPNPERV
ncbi:MAG TPA: DUF2784 domain-containing protein [Gemmatimonadales bacterium]|nr:DUF2784 domain-containing protein [Gemmatimonadales bacterium]